MSDDDTGQWATLVTDVDGCLASYSTVLFDGHDIAVGDRCVEHGESHHQKCRINDAVKFLGVRLAPRWFDRRERYANQCVFVPVVPVVQDTTEVPGE